MLLRRDLETRFQADPAGSFEGYASVYGVKDSYGDTVAPGAFAASDRKSTRLNSSHT